MSEFNKCFFCENLEYDKGLNDKKYFYCRKDCSHKDSFELDVEKVFEKAKEKGLFVSDVAALIMLEGDELNV